MLSLTEILCHFRTLLPFACSHDFLSLVIVTCFAMSFALRSAAIARLVLDASLLHCTRVAIPTLLNFAVHSFFWVRTLSTFTFPFCCCFCCAESFCWTRPPLDADTRSCSPGFVPRCRRACLGGAFLLSFTLVLQARLAPIPRLPILAVWSFSRSLSLSQARLLSPRDLQHRTWRLSCCLLQVCIIAPGDCAVVCSRSGIIIAPYSGPCCESSSGSSVPISALVESRQFSAQP